MKKYFKNKFFYIITVLTLLCTIVPTVYYQMGITFPLRDTLNTLLVPMQKLFLAAADAVDGFTGYFYKFDALVEENAALRSRRCRRRSTTTARSRRCTRGSAIFSK